MKKFLLLLVLLPTMLFAQNSWINIQLLTDNYPEETSWNVTSQDGLMILAQSDSVLLPNTLYNDTIVLSDAIIASLFDVYGDGLGASQWGGVDGWFLIQNDCQDTLMYAGGNFGDTLVNALLIAPCAPPTPVIEGIEGCMNPEAPNFNPWAIIEDNSCVGVGCVGGEAKMILNVTLDQFPSETGWTLTDVSNGQPVYEVPSQTYTFNQANTTISYDLCVPTTGVELILTDTYGDGLAGSLYNGGTDGNFEILGDIDPCGGGLDLIWGVDSANFGNVTYSGVIYLPSCTVILTEGCTDSDYVEYDPFVDVMLYGSCNVLKQYGCTDVSAFNFDELANTNEIISICEYVLTIEDDASDGWGDSYLGVSQGTSSEIFTLGPGIATQSWTLMLEAGKPIYIHYFEVKGEQQSIAGMEFQTMHNAFSLIDAEGEILISGGTNPFANNGLGALQAFQPPLWDRYIGIPYCGDFCENIVIGCTEQFNWLGQEMFNYNPLANTYDPEIVPCVEVTYGCTDPSMFGYYAADPANTDDGSCMPWFIGCMDAEAWNYNTLANIHDGESCVYFGCIDILALNYDSSANTENGSCIYPTMGCMNPLAFNFNVEANVDDDSCVPKIYGCIDPASWNYNEDANTSIDNCIPFIYGCTDISALNYNPMANSDNESCIPIILGCMDVTSLNYNSEATLEDGSCIEILFGCTDETAFNYNEFANLDNESCIPFIFGCTDPTAFNFDIEANIENFSCIETVYGCLDESAFNYNSFANTDNGACIETLIGCTDNSAENYEVSANTDDGSCLYDGGCIGDPGVPYWLNDPCYAWVIDIDALCCDNEWDTYCQSQYNYCDVQYHLTLDDIRDSEVVIYPNPTTGILSILAKNDIKIDVINLLGETITTIENENRIDLSRFSNGMYILNITYNGLTIRHKIIKN